MRYWDGNQWTATPPPPALPPRKRPVWPWIVLGVTVLFFGGCGTLLVVGAVAGHNAAKTSAPSTPTLPSYSVPSATTMPSLTTTPAKSAPSITYEVQSDDSLLSVTYFDGMNDQKQVTNVSAPWSLTFENQASFPIVGVGAQTNGLQVSCTISVNGQVRDQKTATGRYAVVNCTARV
ncbi:hypothetical protein A5725_24585 [Mycobacterium kubicae]|nr:hypothetical protein A5725_24585 [Mycobacterium kubicae]